MCFFIKLKGKSFLVFLSYENTKKKKKRRKKAKWNSSSSLRSFSLQTVRWKGLTHSSLTTTVETLMASGGGEAEGTHSSEAETEVAAQGTFTTRPSQGRTWARQTISCRLSCKTLGKTFWRAVEFQAFPMIVQMPVYLWCSRSLRILGAYCWRHLRRNRRQTRNNG